LTEVHFFWSEILARRVLTDDALADVEAAKPHRPAAVADMQVLREQATSALLTQLASRHDDEPCWSWWPPDQTVGFTRRMQTYEATLHRVDAELTAGTAVTPLGADVAAGAVDHAVDVMWGWLPDGASYQPADVVEFVATDSGRRWLIEVGTWRARDGSEWPRAVRVDAGTPVATVSAAVADLALWAWRRGDSVTFSGASATLAALLAEGMQ
ncbi:MAG: maleylpyruvate isomerase family mycothiol-dependent enzyme, partial [Mycobacterium sp.]|nr:maleylpyruvate isomerase family mycothiol-dependent enzyme [Mycobacterium sp.]